VSIGSRDGTGEGGGGIALGLVAGFAWERVRVVRWWVERERKEQCEDKG
jgi:hypothetical protein